MVKKIIHGIIFLSTLFFISACGNDAKTIIPKPFSQSSSGTDIGTVNPSVISVYPSNGATNIATYTDVIIVFSKPIDISTISGNIAISGVTSFSVSSLNGGNAVKLDITNPVNLAYSTAYGITFSGGILDTHGNPLTLPTGGFSFSTASDNSVLLLPRVISSTRFPSSGSTDVSISTNYVEVTFSKEMDPASVTAGGSFNVSGPGVTLGSVSTTDNKTFRLGISGLQYGATYTVSLNTSIRDSGGNALLDFGNLTWSFSTDSDPASNIMSIQNIWVGSVTDTGATVYFTTLEPLAVSRAFVNIGVAFSPISSNIVEGAGVEERTVHEVSVSGLSPGTLYVCRAWADENGNGSLEAGEAVSGDIYFRTAPDNSVNHLLSNGVGDQQGVVALQTNGTSSYVFWEDHGDIHGQFFGPGGIALWGPGGSTICSAVGSQKGIVAITDGFSDAVVVYSSSNKLYGKEVFNNVGAPGFRWGGGAVPLGADFDITIKPGSSYSACLVHENPFVVTSGVADMPDDGVSTNLVFSGNVNFSFPWLTQNDIVIKVPLMGFNLNAYAIDNQGSSPYDIFPYVLKSSAWAPNLGALSNFYLVDVDSSITGTADSGTTGSQLRSSTVNLMTVSSGDLMCNTSTGEWSFISSDGAWDPSGYWYVNLSFGVASLGDGDSFAIYSTHAGPFNSEAVSNPLWDKDPSVLFNPSFWVRGGDYVVNENDNSSAATFATVNAPVAADTDYALQLSADIMDNGDSYAIMRTPPLSFVKDVGYSTASSDFHFIDTHDPFGSVSEGDIVYNIDADLSAMVKRVVGVSMLILSADIFNSTNEKAIFYTKRGFLVSYIEINNYVMAKSFNMANGTWLVGSFQVCTNGVNSNPRALSDGAGNAMIFYERGSNIYAKKVTARGYFSPAWGNDADSASDPGKLILTGFSILQILPDRALNGVGGAYLLAKANSGAGFRIVQVSGATGDIVYGSPVIFGEDPRMTVDSVTNEINRAIVVYTSTHIANLTPYKHIEAMCYRSGLLWGPINVSDNTAPYNCTKPSVTMANNSTGADDFYVAWFDGRDFIFSPSYSIFGQRYDSTPSRQWAVGGAFLASPSSLGSDDPLSLWLLNWDDGGAPYGIMPLWYDYRDKGTTGRDIYYEQFDENGS